MFLFNIGKYHIIIMGYIVDNEKNYENLIKLKLW